MPDRDLNHPVWEVYNLLRTARLNCKYYTGLLNSAEQKNWWIQLVIAASLPTSTVAGYEIWATGAGSFIWAGVLLLASTLAFLQPFLKLSDKIKTYDSILTGYLTLDYDLQELRVKINNSQAYNSSHKKLFEAAQKRKKKVGIREQGIKLNKPLRDQCTKEVDKELPAKNFYIPEE